MMKKVPTAEMQRLAKKAVEEGRLIEAGWLALRAVWIPPDAPESRVLALQEAFYAGAQHLFASVLLILDEGGKQPRDATPADLQRMKLITEELQEWFRNYRQRHNQPSSPPPTKH